MYPTILYYNDGGVSFQHGTPLISSYGLMLMLAFLICNYLLKKHIVNKGYNGSIADDIIFYAAVGGIVGSKIYYSIEEGIGVFAQFSFIKDILFGFFTFDFNLISISFSKFGSGLTFLGGLIGGMIAVTFYIKYKKLDWLKVSDWVAPYLILGHAIGRIGCFLVGDCYGKPTNLPWGMSFPLGTPPTLKIVHPTQLYEVLTGLSIFLYLIYKRERNHSYKGQIMYEYLFLAGLARFCVEFLRINPRYFVDSINLSGSQFISLFMIIISSVLMYFSRRQYSSLNGND